MAKRERPMSWEDWKWLHRWPRLSSIEWALEWLVYWCKGLAIFELLEVPGHLCWLSPARQHATAERESAADCRRCPSGVSRGLLVIGSQGRLRNPDVKLPIGSSVSYTYAQFLS